jgi:hypothetical protein
VQDGIGERRLAQDDGVVRQKLFAGIKLFITSAGTVTCSSTCKCTEYQNLLINGKLVMPCKLTMAWNLQELVDDLIAGFCIKSLHEEALDILDSSGMAIKDVTFERALKSQVFPCSEAALDRERIVIVKVVSVRRCYA